MQRILIALVLLWCSFAWGDAKLDGLLTKLTSQDADTRDDAADRLTMLPASSVPALQAAMQDSSRASVKPQIESAIAAIRAKEDRDKRRTPGKPLADWWKEMTVDVYDDLGQHDPAWDKYMRRTLTGYVEAQSWLPFMMSDAIQESWDGGSWVKKTACEDPLFFYVFAWANGYTSRAEFRPVSQWYLRAARGIGKTDYPPYWKARILMHGVEWSAGKEVEQTDALKKERAGWLEQALKELSRVPEDEKLPAKALMDLLEVFGLASESAEHDRAVYFNQAYAVLEKSGKFKAELLAARAKFYCDYAWDARGTGGANTVTTDGWQKLHERLLLAEKDANASWTLDSSRPEAAVAMLRVALGDSREREEMEQWFGRAMTADPDCEAAVNSKRSFLMPRWYGDQQQEIAFARQCMAEGNYEGGIPLILPAVYQDYSSVRGKIAPDFFQKHPDAWAETRTVYRCMLRRYPASRWLRSKYLLLAYQTEHWDDVDAILPEMEKPYSYSYLVLGQKKLDEIRQQAAARHGGAATQPGQ